MNSDAEFIAMAFAAQERADCRGNRVGAVIVLTDRVVSAGWNGTPSPAGSCTDGRCLRCLRRDEIPPGSLYDLCICIHAEQRALLSAARRGIAIDGGIVYSTLRPCCGCAKELLEAGIAGVRFADTFPVPDEVAEVQQSLYEWFPAGVRCVSTERA